MFSSTVSSATGAPVPMLIRRRLRVPLALALATAALSATGAAPATAEPRPAPTPPSNYDWRPDVSIQKRLNYAYEVQATSYWCSAAAARIALSVRGRFIRQEHLASRMRVSSSIGLPNIANLAEALNHYTNSNYYEVKDLNNDAALRSSLRSDVLVNVRNGHAVVINVKRIATATFDGHYATIVGYRKAGYEYLVSDPASASRKSIWLTAEDVVSSIKLHRYVA